MLAKWNLAAYVCVGAALALVVAITAWGAYIDLTEVRNTLLKGEINRLRSHAIRTVARIQDRLGQRGATLASAVHEDEWLREYWDRWVPSDESRLFAAITDETGRILMHTDRQLEGGQLDPRWYERSVREVDEDVVETSDATLTGGEPAFDVRVPIIMHDREVATYHSGLSLRWFHDILAEKDAATWTRWAGILGGVLLVVLVAGWSLYQIVKRSIALREAVELSRVRQFAELGELAAGIAHEIRNPLNAIRLNLHALQRLQRNAASDVLPESATIIAEANREIERVEGLMRVMLGYARPEKPVDEDVNIRDEIDATVCFLRPVMEREQVEVQMRLPSAPVYAHIDRNRFRQIMINLLTNAREAVGLGGRIEVHLGVRRETIEIVVADNGPGVRPEDRERIFDPFYSTKELGTGLGLALVKRFVDEAGGRIECAANESVGARFCVTLPALGGEPAPAANGR